MRTKPQTKAFEQGLYEENERDANHYTIRCLMFAAGVTVLIWILNLLDFFAVDDVLMNVAMPIGIGLMMIPLFLELFSLQIRQIINGVHIVTAVPAGFQQEFAWEPVFQFFPVGIGHAGDTAGDSTLFGILQDFLDHCPAVTVADGVGVDAASVEMAEKGDAAMEKCCLLQTPQGYVGEGIFTATGGAGE